MTVIATTSESVTEVAIASEMSLKSCPASSRIVSTGMKTATVVSVDARIATQTSFAPQYDAALMLSPSARRRYVFSSTTMALSTTMPTAKASPASETTLSVRPKATITRNVPITEIGMASEMMPVAIHERRKMSSARAASRPPCQRFSVTSEIAESM